MKEIKILVSDDEKSWRELILARILRSAGYTVKTESNIEDTLARLEKEYFHLVFADICFSQDDHTNTDGVQTVKAIASRKEGTKTIVLTGYGTVDLAVKTLKEYKVFDFLEKGEGIDQSVILEIVSGAVKEARNILNSSFLTVRPLDLFSPLTLHDITAKIELKEQSFIWLMKHLLREVYPINIDDDIAEIQGDHRHYVFTRSLWSRMLGRKVRFYIGQIDDVEKIASLDDSSCLVKSTEAQGMGIILEDT
ncbi:MAG: response regulator [Flavobacteriaceae bacterium]